MSAVMGTYGRYDLTFESGEGVWLTSDKGERYLDCGSGIAVTVLGHAHPRLVEALTNQAKKLWHVSNLYNIPGQERMAEQLTAATFADRVFFGNSGAEACEGAIKMARRYHWANGAPERYRIITFEGCFHGRTLATIAAGNQEKHLEGFGPKVDGFDQVLRGDRAALEAAIGPETAAIMIEPVMGEGGIQVLQPEYLQELRDIADANGLLLIFDEVQTGVGRTGTLFAHQAAGVTPDIMAVAKGIGGGFPLGVCLATEAVGSAMTPGTHGSTFGGNPLAVAVGNAVLDVVQEPGFLDEVKRKGLRLQQGLAALKDEFPDLIEDFRTAGLLCGIKVTPPNGDVVQAMLKENLLTVPAGDNVVRFMPPLTISEDEIVEALARASRALTALSRASS